MSNPLRGFVCMCCLQSMRHSVPHSFVGTTCYCAPEILQAMKAEVPYSGEVRGPYLPSHLPHKVSPIRHCHPRSIPFASSLLSPCPPLLCFPWAHQPLAAFRKRDSQCSIRKPVAVPSHPSELSILVYLLLQPLPSPLHLFRAQWPFLPCSCLTFGPLESFSTCWLSGISHSAPTTKAMSTWSSRYATRLSPFSSAEHEDARGRRGRRGDRCR